MSHFDVLLPFALPPAALARDLLRECKAPALAKLLSRARPMKHEKFDAFARALPHEKWLAHRFGIDSESARDSSPGVALSLMRQLQLDAAPGVWFVLNPVHLHVARDHLVLTDPTRLAVSGRESKNLFDAALPLFEEAGRPLLYGGTHTWFMRADDWHELHTSTPDAACGHNVDIWMPQGDAARAWRKLQNEVQMQWHFHPVNQLREGQGEKTVNSLWLWGGASHAPDGPAPYDHAFDIGGRLGPYAPFGDAGNRTAAELIRTAQKRTLLALDNLAGAALANDWAEWLQQMQRLENDWFAPILSALETRRLRRVALILTDHTRRAEYALTPASLRKFWAKPTLHRLRTADR